MIVLALDASPRRTGWVRGEPGGPIRLGSISLPEPVRRRIGYTVCEWELRIARLIEGVAAVYFEAPIFPMHGNAKATRPLWALASHIEYLCHRAGIDCCEVAANSHKRLIYGSGGAKPANAEALAQAWGFPARNPDEADAAGVFLFAVAREYPQAFAGWQRIRASSNVTRIAREKPQARKLARAESTLI